MSARSVVVDWQQLALNIRRAGTPLRTASRRIGEHIGFVPQLARGEVREPKFSQGIALIDLHYDVCGAEATAELLK